MELTGKVRHGVLFYSCDQLEQEGFPHGFSTRVGGVSPKPWDSLNLGASCGDEPGQVMENIRRFCTALGIDAHTLVKNKQIHTDVVRPVTEQDICPHPEAPGQVEGDGLVTDEEGFGLMVFSADCIPILLCDPKKRVAAALHAGWRGTALGIAARGVQRMVEDYGCCPGDMLAAIGPGIDLCCFETREDVPAALQKGLGGEAAPWIHPTSGQETYHVDLKGANQTWLIRAGLSPARICAHSPCTACTPEEFWSHRRLGTRRGSMASIIQIAKP